MIYFLGGGKRMEYKVVLGNFEGPLDLLLHLIKEKEMNLETLEVSVITDQYLSYIHTMETSQLEVMSEYLVMAADLVEMKSRLLLPKEKIAIEDGYEEDPREKLIRRLIEYKRYKDVLDNIREKYEQRQTVFIKPAENMEPYIIDTSTIIPEGLEVYDLMRAMQKMFQRKALSKPLDTHIARKDISIDERTNQIREYFKQRIQKKVKLEELFEREDRFYFVVTFISVLVLAKFGEVDIIQDGLFDQIYVEGK
jgi:segregation and condensation protein A